MIRNIAHRGYSALYPENTLLAFEKAIEAGCDGIEFDVHLTGDGEIVIIHDEDVARTTDGKGLVKDMTLAQLKELDAGSGQRIPTLAEYFRLVADAPIVSNIELKNSIIWYDGLEEKVIAAAREHGLMDRVLLSSFNHYSIARCKQLAPSVKCGLLCDCWIVDAGAYTARLGAECLHPAFYSLTPDIAEEIRRHGIEINVWTVNNEKHARMVAGLGVTSIITNDPVLIGRILPGL